jgi:hypothetical protein
MALEVDGSTSSPSHSAQPTNTNRSPPLSPRSSSHNPLNESAATTAASPAADNAAAATTTTTTRQPLFGSSSNNDNKSLSTLPQRRDRSRDIIYKRSSSGRDRSNTYESNQSSEFSLRKRRGENSNSSSTRNKTSEDSPIATTDMNLLLASLEKETEVLEDEAEAVSSFCFVVIYCWVYGFFWRDPSDHC